MLFWQKEKQSTHNWRKYFICWIPAIKVQKERALYNYLTCHFGKISWVIKLWLCITYRRSKITYILILAFLAKRNSNACTWFSHSYVLLPWNNSSYSYWAKVSTKQAVQDFIYFFQFFFSYLFWFPDLSESLFILHDFARLWRCGLWYSDSLHLPL